MTLDDLLRLEQQATKGPWRDNWHLYDPELRPVPRHYMTLVDWHLVCASRDVLRELVEVAKAARGAMDHVHRNDAPAPCSFALCDALARLEARMEEMG